MGWPREDDDPSSLGYVDYTGLPTRSELLAYYANESGRPVDEIDIRVELREVQAWKDDLLIE